MWSRHQKQLVPMPTPADTGAAGPHPPRSYGPGAPGSRRLSPGPALMVAGVKEAILSLEYLSATLGHRPGLPLPPQLLFRHCPRDSPQARPWHHPWQDLPTTP
ncbi:hypothetical protein H1C71_025590 [Ictidomys tridecemlineatus]|nr:hypothetical protein H1C71_025590 [Ictidomys tridecemlineatus]